MNKKDPKHLATPLIKEKDGKYYAQFKIFREDGSKVNTNTKLCNTKLEAKRLALNRQKVSLGLLDEDIANGRKKKLDVLFDEWIDFLNKKRKKSSVVKYSGYQTDYENAKTIKSKYFPTYISSLRISVVERKDFADWVKYINNYNDENGNELSYNRVAKLRTTIFKFINYLDENNLFEGENDYNNIKKYVIEKYKLKNKTVGKTYPNIPTYQDIKLLCSVQNRSSFEGLYYYTFFYVAFFSCMRMCELIALTWDKVDFERGFISIDNSINKREMRANVKLRKELEIGETKNNISEREISMMVAYYQLLKNYKTNYIYEFELQDKLETLANAYVFPAIQQRKFEPDEKVYNIYQNTNTINEHINQFVKKINKRDGEGTIKHLSCGKFRHGGCSYLANYHGWFETEMVDYMGHTDSDMIRKVYQKTTKRNKAIRTRNHHPKMFYRNIELEEKERVDKNNTVINHIEGDELREAQHKLDKEQIYNQILYLIKKKKDTYYYREDQDYIVWEIFAEHPEFIDKINVLPEN